MLAKVIDAVYIDNKRKITNASKRGGNYLKIILKNSEDFKKLLIIKGFTQRGLGRAIGVSETYATQLSNGVRNPGPQVARKISETLDVEFDDIFFIENACKSNQTNSA